MSELTIASWNILLDQRYPQDERIEDIAHTLKELDRVHTLGALGLMEVQGSHGQHIAQAIFGNNGDWKLHSRVKRHEHIGMAGSSVENIEFLPLGFSKYAAITTVDDIAIATVHLRRKRGPEQVSQMNALLERFEDEPKAVLMGDFNGIALQVPRLKLWNEGYRSVFAETGKRRQRTVPTSEYIGMLSRAERIGAFILGGGVNVDDIYVKGVEVKDAGYFEGQSDHLGVWARLMTGSTI